MRRHSIVYIPRSLFIGTYYLRVFVMKDEFVKFFIPEMNEFP